MPDGGEVGLDWGEREGAEADMRRDAPILLILAGLTGQSFNHYLPPVRAHVSIVQAPVETHTSNMWLRMDSVLGIDLWCSPREEREV